MSSAAVISVSTMETTSSSLHRTRSNHGGVAVVPKAAIKSSSCRNSASSNAIITYLSTTRKRRNCYSSHVKRFSPVMEWQHCTVKKEIDVPTSVAYQCYADREAIPNWMPFISSVKILEDKPDLSRWSLKYTAFGRDLEFAWIARNMQPILNQKIHWRSLEGLPNRGAVRFFPKGSSSCLVELTVSYEVPQLLAPAASALQPFLEGLLGRGLDRFATYVKSYSTD